MLQQLDTQLLCALYTTNYHIYQYILVYIPVPGGPLSSAPLGILAPKSVNRFGDFKNSTNSMICKHIFIAQIYDTIV
jgi:hypothetical protein